MKVVTHSADKGGCGSYRLRWPVEALSNRGYDVEDRHSFSYDAEYTPSVLGDRITNVQNPIDADVIVLQRPLSRHLCELMTVLQDKGAAVVVEIDDDFGAMPLMHSGRDVVNPLNPANRDKNWDWLQRCCDKADWVTCTTPKLAERYGRHGRVSVIPNYVPERYLSIQRPEQRERPWVGWSGSTVTHVGDLEVTKGAIGVAMENTNAELHVIGTGEGVERGLQAPLTHACGWVDIEDYPTEMAKLDVGLVPLKMSRFNQAKSWLKGLEFAALGVPFVATATEPYKSLAELGIGVVVRTPQEWCEEVTALLSDEERRRWKAEAARAIVAESLTLEANCEQFWNAWEMACEHRNSAIAA